MVHLHQPSAFRAALRDGLAGVRHRAGLVLLLYGFHLGIAFVLTVPLYVALSNAVARTGFGPDLAEGFDLILWADVFERIEPMLPALALQLLWAVPLLFVWHVAAGVGLVHALRGRGGRSFWQGVGRYTGRGLLLALAFVSFGIGLGLLLAALEVATDALWPGEVASFWWNVALVGLLAGGLALLVLLHDYARVALVAEDLPVRRALRLGLGWPLRHGAAVGVYLAWSAAALAFAAAPTLFDLFLPAATPAGIWGLFAVQQFFLLFRTAATVGRIGSETACFETLRQRALPLLAEEPRPMPQEGIA